MIFTIVVGEVINAKCESKHATHTFEMDKSKPNGINLRILQDNINILE